MCTVVLPPGVNPTVVKKYIILRAMDKFKKSINNWNDEGSCMVT